MWPRAKLSPTCRSWWSQHHPESNQYWNFAARSGHGVYCAWNHFSARKKYRKMSKNVFTGTFDFLGAKKKLKKRPSKKKWRRWASKKKRWADDGRRWAMCPSNKKKEDGRPPPKKKMGKHPSLLSYFLAPIFCLNISFFITSKAIVIIWDRRGVALNLSEKHGDKN